jgi:hypothetical protein
MMKDFNKIKLVCEENNRISTSAIDEFLIYYAAGRNNLEDEMNRRFADYRHISKEFPKELVNMLKSQFIALKIFRRGGLIKSLLNSSGIQRLKQEEIRYLEYQEENPWRFSFSVIKNMPEKDFYIMEDVFNREEYLLFSPGTGKVLESQAVILWFNLITFNGYCYQTFGPIGSYSSFEPDDIYFFATELNPAIGNEEELLTDVEKNPLPYMMLLSGSTFPLVVNKKDQIVHEMSEYEVENFDTKSLAAYFKTQYNKGIYRFSLKKWSEHPHFAQVYYDEEKKVISLYSMTDRGYKALVKELNEYGFDLESDPQVRVNPSMASTASNILRKKIDFLKYEHFFSKESSPEAKEEIDKLNKALELAIPEINASLMPDIKAISEKTGADPETLKNIVEQLIGKLNKVDDRRKKK